MRVFVKVCGLTEERDVEAAVEAGVDAIGLVLCPSPRRVGRHRAERLLERVPSGIERIAVTAEPQLEELDLFADLPFDGLQAEVEGPLPDPLRQSTRFLLRSLRDGADLERRLRAHVTTEAESAPTRPSLRGALLLDGPGGGGRGIEPALERASRAARLCKLVLAGGLTPENVGAAIAGVRPFAVDASSGLEVSRGKKSPARIRAFVGAVRDATRTIEEALS